MAASLIATLFANSAIAGTWTATATATSYAAELFGDGTVLIDPGTANYQFSSTPSAGTAFNADFTLAGASWGTALTSGSLTLAAGVANATGVPAESGTASITLVEGGGVADSTAKFRRDVTETFINTAGRILILDYNFDGASGLSTPAASVTLAMGLVDTLGAIDTAGTAAAIASSAEGSTFATLPSTNSPDTGLKLIDVSSGSTTFVDTTAAGTLVNDLGSFTITNTSARIFGSDGVNGVQGLGSVASTAWTIGSGISTSATGATTITITGDFSAALAVDADSSALTFDGVQMSGCTTANATTLDATTATFTVTDAVLAGMAGTACDITLNVDGATILQPQTPSVAFAFDYGNVDYRDETGSGNLATLSKNGASAAADLILTPGGVFDGFVRVSNKSGVGGKVIVTMYNDAGNAVTFDLDGGTLASQASTALVSAADLYAQAQAADSTFAHNDGKLRAVFEGEFSAIAAQSVTISTDNTTFTTF